MIVAPTAQLVGRAAEVEVLDRAVAGLEDGYGGALSIVGAPGIGKSRLLAELGNRADAKGFLVLAGGASELERDLPFGVFVNAIDEYLESLESRRLERLEEEVRVELARLFPSLASFGGGGGEALQDERYRVHRAVRILLETLATRPLILVLDDFHWTDSGSVELAGALLRRPPAARVLLVLGIRPRQLPQRLASELSHAERDGTLTRIELEPLSLEDARELLGEAVSSSLAEVLYEESGGVPFYLEQLARVPSRIRGAAAGGASSEILAGIDVPPMVVDALREELSLLSASTRLVLQGAAVAGDPFEPELAAVAAECAEPTALDALDELLRLDFVRTTVVADAVGGDQRALEQLLVADAVGGDQRALEQLLRAVAVDVRRLAQRMLWHPQDAEDAMQEILVKVATRLSTFRGDARVTTWVHRIAVNHLLTMRRGRAEDPALTFTDFGDDLARDLDAAYDPRGVDDEFLAQEVMVGCTQGMLLCLDREHRVAYVLGELL